MSESKAGEGSSDGARTSPPPPRLCGGEGLGERGRPAAIRTKGSDDRQRLGTANPPLPRPLPPAKPGGRGARPLTRRTFLTTTALLAASARAQPPERKPAADFITPDAQRAIDRGLNYLVGRQHPDGFWGQGSAYSGNVGVTSLCGLALMAGGHQPGRGPHGQAVTRAVEYVLSREQEVTPGFLWQTSGSSHGAMYSHGFGTLLLGEAHGTIADRALRTRVRTALSRAVQLALGSQNDGGWRYEPRKVLPDVSVTICVIMALRSARNAGVDVPKGAIDKTVEYVKACQTPDGGFRYFKQGGGAAFPRSAAGLVALYSAGVYDGKEVDNALKYLMLYKPGTHGARRDGSDLHYYYGQYYAAQAMWTAGDPYWSEWFPAVRDEMLVTRRPLPEGAWKDPTYGNDYATAMATIVLQIPNNYLPILQK